MPDELLTLPEVAQLLKADEKTVYTMAQRGVIPAFKVRGQWRLKRADLIDMARAEPITIEKHGRAVVVELGAEEYERLKALEKKPRERLRGGENR